VRYVTLSYVWGQSPMTKLSLANLERYMQEGALQEIRTDLPKTINDAIDLVSALGERYLWVDALCLIQDDVDDVTLGVEQMNSIYRGSYFTIVAASGADARAGLPGLPGHARKVNQATAEVGPGIAMMVRHSIDWHLERSVYNQRGWTLQEFVLPRRTLIFINNQVYFRCQEANWCEESWSDSQLRWVDDDDSNISRFPSPMDDGLQSFWAYQKLCEEYSRRKLSGVGDSLRAASGIIRPLVSGMDTFMVEGLPGFYLDHFLLFISADGQMKRRKQFASYSWAGWEGNFMWPRENYYWFENGSRTWDMENIIKWLYRKRLLNYSASNRLGGGKKEFWPWRWKGMKRPPPRIMELIREHEHILGPRDDSFAEHGIFNSPQFIGTYNGMLYGTALDQSGSTLTKEEEEMRLLRAEPNVSTARLSLANSQAELECWAERAYENQESSWDLPRLRNWLASRRASKYLHDSIIQVVVWGLMVYQEIKIETRATGRSTVSLRDELEASHYRYRSPRDNTPSECISYYVLQFRTISIHLRLGEFQREAPGADKGSSKQGKVQSFFNRIPGIPLFVSCGAEVVGSLHPDNLAMLPKPGSMIECLVLSRCQMPTMESALSNNPEAHGESGGASGGEAIPWDLLWVLYCVWEGSVAVRRGIGQILTSVLDKAVDPLPEVKDVNLG
jgi:hypothetical protein